ncbi:MAG: WhiB family transcriptional regulator [Acidimicrobiia bacterium]|nr:WhiB family transcriptional regulator [Acidimicrobiia bacterium]
MCRGCRVRVDCATFALGYSTRDLTGVWGGLPGSVRRDARRYGWTAEEAIELADLRDRLDRLAG